MAPRKDNTNSSPPGTPGSDEARFSPIPITWSPVTPYSQVRPGTARHTSNLRSPLEAPNDRRRNLGGVSQHDSGESSNEVNVAKVEQYYKEQYDGQIQKCIAAIRKLERENRTLSQSAGPDYLLQLEDTIQTLETSNSQLTSENKSLKLSEQSWRARSERLSVELAESGKDLLAANNKNIGGTKDKNSAETKELIKDLRAVREENTELYDKCISMQETIDKLEASGGDKAAMAAKLQLIQISEHTILTAAERSSMKVDLVELSDQMDQQIELRMLAKGSMFFDDGNASHGLEVNLLELEELKDTIRSQQDEIETLREAADDHFSTRPGPIKDGLPAPVSSLENEFRKRIEVLTQELETTRDQLVKQEAYASALKVFKDQISHPTTGNAFQNLNGKIHTMDQMILNLIAKIQELQRDFEARLLESSTGSDFAEAGDIAEKLHDVREGFGKMVLLSNDIQVINNEAKEELAVDVTHKQEVVEKPKIEIPPPKSILKTAAEKIETLPPKSTLKIAAEKIVEPMKLEQYKPTTTQETRLIKSEPKTFMERLWTNLNDGVTDDNEDLIWPSSPIPGSVVQDLTTTTKPIPRIIDKSDTPPPLSLRLWTEMLCVGKTYWTQVAIKDRYIWVKISGPSWWSLIIQVLMVMLVPSCTVAWWCIMAASAERELWLDANEMTYQKYWDTNVWGAERDLLWRVLYGLGYA